MKRLVTRTTSFNQYDPIEMDESAVNSDPLPLARQAASRYGSLDERSFSENFRRNQFEMHSPPLLNQTLSTPAITGGDVEMEFVLTERTTSQHLSQSMDRLQLLVCPPYLLPSLEDLRQIQEDQEAKDAGVTLPPLTRQQIVTVVMLSFANFASTVVFSCIAPFFPSEAKSKGASETVIGLIFGVFELAMFIVSPIFGHFMTKIGSKFMYGSGLFVTGVTALLFGLLNLSPPGSTFIALCFTVRTFEAIGDAAFLTASFSIIANEFQGRVATMIGILEIFSGLGFAAGPPIGGALYSLGGFQLPFSVLGVLLIIAALLSIPLIPPQDDRPREKRGTYTKLLRIPMVLLMVLLIVSCAIALSFFDPTLEPHLSSFHLSSLVVGLMFLVIGGIYALTAPFWGFLVDRFKNRAHLITIFGSFNMFIGYLLIGPAPIFPFEKSLWLIAVAEAFIGLGVGAALIPPFQLCLEAAKKRGYPDNFDTYGLVSGLFQSSMAFGAFFGPTLGGISVDNIGFGTTSSFVSILHFGMIIISSAFLIISAKKLKLKSILDRNRNSSLARNLNDFSQNPIAA